MIAISSGVLAVEPHVRMAPLVRIEAWRLLARGKAAIGDTAAAQKALEEAMEGSKAVGYVWMQRMVEEQLSGL